MSLLMPPSMPPTTDISGLSMITEILRAYRMRNFH
jgi:hypothetical protein